MFRAHPSFGRLSYSIRIKPHLWRWREHDSPRSATVPLSQPFVDTCGQDWTINVLNLLVAETERWEHIDVWAGYRINSHMLPFKIRLPALKSITVAIPPEVSDNTIFSPFTEVPLLRDLRIVQGRGSHSPHVLNCSSPLVSVNLS